MRTHGYAFRFTLRWSFLATALIAVGLWLSTSQPSWKLGIAQLLFALALPACLLDEALASRGYRRAFLIGAFVSTIVPSFCHLTLLASESTLLYIESLTVRELSTANYRGVDLVLGFSIVAECFWLVPALWCLSPVVGAICVGYRYIRGQANGMGPIE